MKEGGVMKVWIERADRRKYWLVSLQIGCFSEDPKIQFCMSGREVYVDVYIYI